MSRVIEVRSAGVALGGRPILRDIDAHVDQGEVVALLGPNGSGKSTLMKAILGLVPLVRGSIELFGTALSDFERWSELGYVPQRNTTVSGVPATVREVVSTGRLSHRRPFRPARREDREAVTRALATVGLGDRAHSHVATLSGGQHQRLLMARALAGAPSLLMLDEPNAGVDLPSQARIAQALAALAADGATIVVVLHELGPLAPLIQRTIVMEEGRIAYDGPPSGAAAADHAHHDEDLPLLLGFPGFAAPLEGSEE